MNTPAIGHAAEETRLREEARNTPAGQLLARMGLDYWDTEALARRVAEHAAAEIAALVEQTRDTPALETERLRLLENKIIALWQAPAERKRAMNYPEAIIGGALVPLSIVSNRLGVLVPFRDMRPPERARWIRANAALVGCTCLDRYEARAEFGCAAELIRIEC